MRIISAEGLAAVFTFPALIDALRGAFRAPIVMPQRHHHTIVLPAEPDATLLLMPAWHELATSTEKGFVGVKIVTVHPGNSGHGLSSVAGLYVLMDVRTGTPLALIDGPALTLWRTAAASALAASYLARPDARHLLMVGAGALAPYLIAAHASSRPIENISVWNWNSSRAKALAAELATRGYRIRAVEELGPAVREADIVSCATLSHQPLIKGAWLRLGTHLDLVGAFTPKMRESDDEAVRRARIFVDTRAGATSEGGDIVLPLSAGVIDSSAILGDLFDLCRGDLPGRQLAEEITLFKSVGAALEDLAAASLALALCVQREAS
jgi:ornithine cyclodeaminase